VFGWLGFIPLAAMSLPESTNPIVMEETKVTLSYSDKYEEKSQHLSFFAFCKEHGAVDFVENPQKPGSFFGLTADGTHFALGNKFQSKDAINAVSDKDFIENYYFVEVRDKMDPEAQWFWAMRSNNSANSVRRISIA